MKRRRSIILVAAVTASAVAAATFGAAAAITGRDDAGVPAALNDPSLTPAQTPEGALGLAAAVNRWQGEADAAGRRGPGRPVVGRTSQLLSAVGSERDTVNAFPTDKGLVCFEIREAGTCGELGSVGLTYAILSTQKSTRVYGVVADRVERVEVDVNGQLQAATLRNNGYHYELAPGTPRNAVKGIVATWTDGSKHTLPIRLN